MLVSAAPRSQSPAQAPDAPGSAARTNAESGRPLPAIAVLTTLFPSAAQPLAGLFIRERMFRIAKHARVIVVAPQPWFPLQSLIRRFAPNYRPVHPAEETQDGVRVLFPRFLSAPGVLRWLDGVSIALCVLPLMRRLKREYGIGIIDAHFAYPAGHAAVLMGRWLGIPVSITLRGTEKVHLGVSRLRKRVVSAVKGADRVFSVSDALRQLLVSQGVPPSKIDVIGNGVDLSKFYPMDKLQARRELGLPEHAKVLVSVGGLVERKGFHRVLAALPALKAVFPDLHYLIVGGPSPAGDMGAELRAQVRSLGLESCVTFTGAMSPERLRVPLSAADVFVLATRYEGWANVFLEAMACGLPIVTTRVGGNPEVVSSPDLGLLVPFDDQASLVDAVVQALKTNWDGRRIMAYAQQNTWDARVALLLAQFRDMTAEAETRHQAGKR